MQSSQISIDLKTVNDYFNIVFPKSAYKIVPEHLFLIYMQMLLELSYIHL